MSSSEQQSQLSEYQSQLSDIELLLAESPDDESLLKLKSDLIELIQLTEQDSSDGIGLSDNKEGEEHKNEIRADVSSVQQEQPELQNHQQQKDSSTIAATGTDATSVKSKSSLKKSKKILSKPFEIPPHLIPLDSDTDAEKKRKKRAVKALKAQYKATRKTVESEVKQQSWQDFNRKNKRKKLEGESIFKTEDGIGARTGVITGSVQVKGQERNVSNMMMNNSSKKQRHLF